MITVKNLTNSPYDLQTTKGLVRLPAFGEVSGEFTGDYLQLLEASMAVKVLNASSKSADGDRDEIARLRAEYQGLLGKRPFPGWGAEELQKRIDEALAA